MRRSALTRMPIGRKKAYYKKAKQYHLTRMRAIRRRRKVCGADGSV